MILKITAFHFQEITEKGYSLDQLFLLSLVQEGYDIQPLLKDNDKIGAIYQSLIRKDLITDNGAITLMGNELLLFINSKKPRGISKTKIDVTGFEKWWAAYPSTNTFKYKGKTFIGERSMRVKRDDCQISINKILLEGKYTIDLLIQALNYEVIQKKEASIKQNSNKLTYMHNSLTYLNQRDFESFIDLINQGIEPVEKSTAAVSSGTDI